MRPLLRSVRSSGDHGLDDEEGIRSAYTAHGAELYRFARRSLGDPGVAQDAVQETFLRAWRAAHRYDPELSSLRVWLFAIARNVVIDVARHRSTGSYAHVAGDADLVQNLLSSDPDRADRVLDSWVIEEALGRVSAEHTGR